MSQRAVKFLCVDVKSSETQERLKEKVLKAINNSEKRSATITHPLQCWTEEAYTFPELSAEKVLKVVTNSSHVAFLLRDGRVCRICVASWEEESASSKTLSMDALRQSQQRPSFQVLGDEEYARQLQVELNSDFGSWEQRGEFRNQFNMYRNIDDMMHGGRLDVPYVVLDDNSMPSGWTTPNTLNTGLAGRTSSNFVIDMPAPRSTTRRGVAKGDRTKPARVWPEMGGLEWLVMKQNPENPHPDSSFVAIAAMHSEILLVSSESRQLYSWASTSDSTLRPHPLSEELGLKEERISLLEASDIKATLVTESGKIASFYDGLLRSTPGAGSTLPSLVQTLTHKAQIFPELEGEQVAHVAVSNFLTCAVTASGRAYWWGLCPPAKTSTPNAPHQTPSSSRGTITDGSLVRLRNGPPCGPNAMVFNTTGHKPRVGKTMNIIEHSGLDPKTSILVKVFKDLCNVPTDARYPKSKLLKELDGEGCYDGLEVWSLSDVVFLDDSPAVLGRVVTVDQLQAIVDISCASSESGTMGSTSVAQSTLKVYKLTDIEPCMDKHNTVTGGRQGAKGEGLKIASDTPMDDPMEDCVRVSLHIAGIVQHRPALFLTPSSQPLPLHTQPHPPRDQDTPPTTPPCTCISNYYPLAIHLTDNGPIMLVKRVSDGAAFLVCSGHPGFPSFSSTSFVSLSPRDAKPGRATIDEESVSAYDGGLDREDWSSSNGVKKGLNTEEEKGLNIGEKNGLNIGEDSGLKSQSSGPSHPSFIQLHKSDAMFLHDSNGVICPLSEGLRLSPSQIHSGQRGKKAGPVQPYKCVATRFHTAKNNSTALIVVVVPEPQQLMPAVMSGDTAKVNSILTRLAKTLSNQSVKHPQRPRHNTSTVGETSDETMQASVPSPDRERVVTSQCSISEPPAKKSKILELDSDEERENSEAPSLVPSSEFVTLSEADMTKLDFDAELSVLSSEYGGGVVSGWGMEVLREKTDQNCTILHVCSKLDRAHTSKGKGGGSVLSSKSISSGLGGSTLSADKSFEEMRFEHVQGSSSIPECPASLEIVEGSCLPLRLLWMLGHILDCQPIRATVVDLLCCCNREGHTPFISAICSQNYAAALKILEFVERISPSHPSLFERAILKPAQNKVSTLHLVLGSMSPTFDLKSMALYVHNLQLNTAKQLLRLFQVRYPSAFKAEIVNKCSSKEETDGSNSSSGDSEQATSEVRRLSRYPLQRERVGRSYRNIPRRPIARSHDQILPQSKYGVVYFSDVTELRAAVQEMHGFRIVSSMSRNTGFGATQTISYLSISREEPSHSADEADAYTYLADRGGPSSHMATDPVLYEFMDSVRGVASGDANNRAGSGMVKRKTTPHMLSSPELLRKLLRKLLSYPCLVTSLDSAGETALASVVHNPRCIEKLLSLSPSTLAPSLVTPVPSTATGLAPATNEQPYRGREMTSRNGNLTCLQRTSILPYVTLDEHVEQQAANLSHSLFLPVLATLTDHTPFQDMDCAPSPRCLVDVINSHYRGVAPQDISSLTDRAGEDVLDSATRELEEIVTHKVNEEVSERNMDVLEQMNSQPLPPQSSSEIGEGLKLPTPFKQEGCVASLLGKRSSSTSLLGSSTETGSLQTPESLKEPLLFGTGSSLSDVQLDLLSQSHSVSKSASDDCNDFSLICALFSSWPAIVTTILGFDMTLLPASDHSTLLPPPTFSSVHLLDSFITDLLLNCSEQVIDDLVDTIMQRLTSALEEGGDRPDSVDATLFMKDIDYGDPETVSVFAGVGEVGVAVLVGRRFLSSVVRVLALEHSRVKNRFLEMQQQTRQEEQDAVGAFGALGVPVASRRGGGVPDNAHSSQTNKKTSIAPSIMSILSRFSWLSVHALSQAAEACASPVRLGVSKPLGASSVIADYQSSGRGYLGVNHYTSMNNGVRQTNRGLVRQLHIRAARATSSATRACSLPSEGVFLQPQLDNEATLTGSTRATGLSALNTSINESSEDEELAHPMVGVATNAGEETSLADSHSHVTPPPVSRFPIDPTSPPYTTQIHNGVFLNLDTTSSSDGEGYQVHTNDYLDWVDGGTGGGANEEDNPDSVYMFAWALDGRRIGENGTGPTGRAESPNSITAPLMFNSTHEATLR